MTRKEFLPVYHGFADMRGLKRTGVSVEMWYLAVKDLTVDQFQNAIVRFVRESTEFPSPAEIRRYAGIQGLESEDRADMAWRAVFSAIAKVGAYETVSFDDPAINAAIRGIGGWVALCDTTSDEMKWKERDFKRAYRSVTLSRVGNPSPLPGIHQLESARSGQNWKRQRTIATGLTPCPVKSVAANHSNGVVKALAEHLSVEHRPVPRLTAAEAVQ